MLYNPMKLRNEINITDVVTVHYLEFSREYEFCGEQHDFWELVYADKGPVYVLRGDEWLTLDTGDMIFHAPNEWHTIKADGKTVPNVAIVSFITKSRAMAFFEGKVMHTGKRQRELLSAIIRESSGLFITSLGDPFVETYERRANAPFGAEQLIRQYTAELLISLIRDDIRSASTMTENNSASELVRKITEYMETNLNKKITIAELAGMTNTGKTYIEKAFRNEFGTGAIERFINMKIARAKEYIRERDYNISQIAELLGYDSVHYFSRQFKKVTGMSPTEYSKSIKAIDKQGGKLNG